MPILKSLFSNEGAFFMHQNVAIQFPPSTAPPRLRREGVKGRMFYIIPTHFNLVSLVRVNGR